MILVVDIGNTNVAIGVFTDSKDPVFFTRLPDKMEYLSGEWKREIVSVLSEAGIKGRPDGAIICSVVPELTDVIFTALSEIVDGKVIKLDSTLKNTVEVAYYDRQKLGSDRLADIAAAVALYGAPVAVFDIGTATTLSVADEKGCFIGGMIMPGVKLSLDSLSARTALLPFVELKTPEGLLGNDTVTGMINGVVYGTAAMIDGLTQRVEEHLKMPVTAVLTGGTAEMIVPYCKRNVLYDEFLLLKGLKIFYDMNS